MVIDQGHDPQQNQAYDDPDDLLPPGIPPWSVVRGAINLQHSHPADGESHNQQPPIDIANRSMLRHQPGPVTEPRALASGFDVTALLPQPATEPRPSLAPVGFAGRPIWPSCRSTP